MSHDRHVTIWDLKMASAPNMVFCWSKHDEKCWNDVAVMGCDANTRDKGLFYNLWQTLVLKFHAVRASELRQVCKQFDYLLAQKVNKVIPYLLY